MRKERCVSDGVSLECRDLAKNFTAGSTQRVVLQGLSLAVNPSEFTVILGPSGCGKTTMLRCLSGLIAPDSGSVTIDGRPVKGVPTDVAVVFQEYNKSLFPWMSLDKNIRFGLHGLDKRTAIERSARALERVQLSESADLYPWQVSGGMQQRAAIARALAREAKLLIMDEPFASVDALTRLHLENMLLDIWQESRFTVVFVTHDIEEAIYLADRVIVLSGRPTHVRDEIVVDLPRPRHPVETKGLPRFRELHRRAFDLIEGATPARASEPARAAGADRADLLSPASPHGGGELSPT